LTTRSGTEEMTVPTKQDQDSKDQQGQTIKKRPYYTNAKPKYKHNAHTVQEEQKEIKIKRPSQRNRVVFGLRLGKILQNKPN
jgi:hypothetical protein